MRGTAHIRLLPVAAAVAIGLGSARLTPNAEGAARTALRPSATEPARSEQAPDGVLLDEVIPPGANFDKAEFRMWYPKAASRFQAILLLVPGSNGDGRNMAEDTIWQRFATRHNLALVALHLTDKPHEQSFIEHYIYVSQGSGDALFAALSSLAKRSNHPELDTAPMLLWGMSAGGEFNYEFVAWKPERVLAFVVNKGGIYYTALASRATRSVPGMLFIGGKDLDSRKSIITGLFYLNRRGAALWGFAEEPNAGHIVGKSLWGFAEEPNAGHIVGRSRDVAMVFYEDVLGLRLGNAASGASTGGMRDLDEKSGFLGDLKAKTIRAVADSAATNYTMAWFPTARVAKAWLAMVTEQPFDP